MTASLRIVRVLAVVDTRQLEEIGDRWVPIVGSGTEHDCARCGRAHEIHATVRLEDGSEAIVGIGCARMDDVQASARFKSLVSATKTLGRLMAEQKAALATVAILDGIWQRVARLAAPEVRIVPLAKRSATSPDAVEVCCGAALGRVCWAGESAVTQEDRESAVRVWREWQWTAAAREAGTVKIGKPEFFSAASLDRQLKCRLAELKKKIGKAEKKRLSFF